jgi:UDP-N-acetylmuramoyl-tripeptide--D-alanyl-D-alanine ligase
MRFKRRLAHALPELVWLSDDIREAKERSRVLVLPVWGLAKLKRRRLDDVVFVGVTGSAAKTTAKELIAAVLRSRFTVVSTRGNDNAAAGTARTMLRASPEDDFGVFELATEAPGGLQPLVDLVRPRIGVVTSVGLEHLENFGNADAIAAEKATLVKGLPADGLAVLNADDPKVLAMREKCAGRVVTVGLGDEAALRAEDVEAAWPARVSFTLRHDGSTVRVQTGLCGRHWVQPVLAAIAVGLEAGVPLTDAAHAIAKVTTSRGRMQPIECADGVTFIRDDQKHDLPTAMRALDFLEEATASRKIAVIGRVGDIEGDPYEEYAGLAARALEVADEVIFTGPESKYAPAPENGRLRVLPTVKETFEHLRATARAGDLVLLRASNRSHLGRIALAHTGDVACWLATCGRRRMCERCELLSYPSEPASRLPSRLLPTRPQPTFPVQ